MMEPTFLRSLKPATTVERLDDRRESVLAVIILLFFLVSCDKCPFGRRKATSGTDGQGGVSFSTDSLSPLDQSRIPTQFDELVDDLLAKEDVRRKMYNEPALVGAERKKWEDNLLRDVFEEFWKKPAPVPSQPVVIDSLEDVLWTAVVDGGPRRELWVRFDRDRASYFDGCNHARVGFTRPAPGKLALGPVNSTKMLCDDVPFRLSLSGPEPDVAPGGPVVLSWVLHHNRVELTRSTDLKVLVLVTPQLYAIDGLAGRWQLAKTSRPAWDSALGRDEITVSIEVKPTGKYLIAAFWRGDQIYSRNEGRLFRTQDRLRMAYTGSSYHAIAEHSREGGEVGDDIAHRIGNDPEYRLEGDHLFLRGEGDSLVLLRR